MTSTNNHQDWYLVCANCSTSYLDTNPKQYQDIGPDCWTLDTRGRYCSNCHWSFCEKCGGVGNTKNHFLCKSCSEKQKYDTTTSPTKSLPLPPK